MIKIYTDGSYKPSTNQGGYASIIINDDKIVKILQQGYINTTNNRMEIMGVLKALEFFKTPQDIIIYSDSSYVVSSISNNYVQRWVSDNDTSKKNMDLWSKILNLSNFHNVKFVWVKGHNDNRWNELADIYANISATVENPQIDLED